MCTTLRFAPYRVLRPLCHLTQRAESTLGGPIEEGWRMEVVRDVAPHKEMVCMSFRLPEWTRQLEASKPAKRPRT